MESRAVKPMQDNEGAYISTESCQQTTDEL